MRKLILTCDSCGQRMQVPRSAIGRTGMCPSCGATIKIRSTNTVTEGSGGQGSGRFLGARGNWWRSTGAQPTEDAKRKFGEAVDLYYGGRYAEALAIFDGLARQFPGNPDIESGRTQCMSALKRPQQTFAIEDQSGGGGQAVSGGLDEETVRRIVLDKMLRSHSEMVQLQAAEIAAKLLGLFDKPASEAAAEPESDANYDTPDDEETGESGSEAEYGDENTNGEAEDEEESVDATFEENESAPEPREAPEPRRRTRSTGFFEL